MGRVVQAITIALVGVGVAVFVLAVTADRLHVAGVEAVGTCATNRDADTEGRIGAFWQRVNALQPTDYLSACDVGQWAFNVIDRDPNTAIRVDDFKVVTANMQSAFDAARGHAPVATPPPIVVTPAPTASPTPLLTATPTPVPPTDVTGNWSGTSRNPACRGAADAALVLQWSATFFQDGTVVTGTFNFGGQTFPIRGSLNGTTLTFASSTPTIDTGFEATVSGRSMTGSYTVNYPNTGACPYAQNPQRGSFEGGH